MTGRFLKLPSDASQVARVKVAGIEIHDWSPRHGGWLYIFADQANAHVKVKLTTGRVLEFGDSDG
jgi:hypothetical protein